jgi:hypothetical protein
MVSSLEEAPGTERLKSEAFTSALSINDFAACAALGLEPVQMVQGSAVLAQSQPLYSGGVSMTGQRFAPSQSFGYTTSLYRKQMSQGYWRRYKCPHTYDVISSEHPTWGANAEQILLHSAWQRGFDAAMTRMVDQARVAGAHGVIGVVDTRQQLADTEALEYKVTGTAVRVVGADAPPVRPWTTQLAGQPLVNVISSGYMPLSAMVQRTWIAVWPYCVTQFFLEGKLRQRGLMGDPVQEVVQVSDAKMKLVELATAHLREKAQGDPVYGMKIEWGDHHLGSGAWVMNVTVRATQLRCFEPTALGLSVERILRLS